MGGCEATAPTGAASPALAIPPAAEGRDLSADDSEATAGPLLLSPSSSSLPTSTRQGSGRHGIRVPAVARTQVWGSDGVRSQPALARASCVTLGLRPHTPESRSTHGNVHTLARATQGSRRRRVSGSSCDAVSRSGELEPPGSATQPLSPKGPRPHRLSTPPARGFLTTGGPFRLLASQEKEKPPSGQRACISNPPPAPGSWDS